MDRLKQAPCAHSRCILEFQMEPARGPVEPVIKATPFEIDFKSITLYEGLLSKL